MAAKGKKPAAEPASAGQETHTVRVVASVSDDTPVYYANFAEAASSFSEFSLTFSRVPSRPTLEQLAGIRDNQIVAVEPLLQIVIPTTMIPGLIKALTAQRRSYESQFGPIREQEGSGD